MDVFPRAVPPDSTRSPSLDEAAPADERQRLRTALEAADLGTWQYDPQTGQVALDARARRHSGLGAGDAADTVVPLAALVARLEPADRPRLLAELSAHLGPGGSGAFTADGHVVDDDGGVRELVAHVRVEFEGEGQARRASRVYGTSQDVTEARAAARQLTAQSLLLREVGEIATVGGWEFDTATGLGSWTEETYRIHGLDGQPPLASSGLERFDGEARDRIEAALQAALTAGTPYDLELPFTCVRGVKKWVRAVCRPVVDAHGRVVRLRGTLQDITDRKRSELALNRFMHASPVVIYALAMEGGVPRLVWTGGDLERVTGWTPEEAAAPDWWQHHLHPQDRVAVEASTAEVIERGHVAIEFRFARRDGSYFWVRDERRLVRDAEGRPSEVVGSWSDITERVGLEAQLRQSQKLEAIGQLAGGVAHDFNNLLTIILGNCELLDDVLPPHAEAGRILEEIREAGERAAGLTRQLLAFSRKQTLQPTVLSLNVALGRVERMLRRLIGEDIAIELRLDPEVGYIRVDPGQLEQVVLNLAVNARDAMPNGGTLTLATDLAEESEIPGPPPAERAPHGYVRLAIGDTGTGMSPDVQMHMFEPFFTTKPAGRGTGLGLATVFGIVNQSGGRIGVRSIPDHGTTVDLFFPRAADAAGLVARESPARRGNETILLVEDDADVRRVAARALARHGYRVIEAMNADDALAVVGREPVALLLTDVVMPGLSGSRLAAAIRAAAPDVKVLFMSGYVQDALERQGLSDGREELLHKPFSTADLARRVREVLDAP